MRRLLLACLLTCVASIANAQPGKVPRIAYIWLYNMGPSAPYHEAFARRLGELGWKDGANVRIEHYDAKGDMKRLDTMMEEVARSNVDLIVAVCTPEARAARKATSTIPIVVAVAGDLVKSGLVTNYSRPGGNLTGFSAVLLEMSAKRIEYLKEAFPKVRKATVLWNPQRPDNEHEVKAMQAAGKRLGIDIQSAPVRSREELATSLEMLQVDGTEAILNTGDTLLSLEVPAVVKRAGELRIPGIYEARVFPDHGGLMSYGPNLPTLHASAAEYADKILRGAKPGDLPIQQPARFELVINRKVAKAQGFRIPESLLLAADVVID
jgi:putative ABC transport system substrate-binding protein